MRWGAVGGGIFAKTAKTPPLQSAFAGMALRSKCRPLPPPYVYHATHGDPGFYHDAARRVATFFEKWNCLIETYLPVRRGFYKRLNLSGPFAAVSLLEYGGLNPIPPFLRGRSDAACRVATLPFAVPVDAHVVANDGRWRCIATESPQMPTVGAGSSQREDFPAHVPLYAQTARAPRSL